MNKALGKWTPAVGKKKADNIISSQARLKGHLGFSPTYENKGTKEQMNFLMSNEYMRTWFKERAVYEKYTYTREQIIKEENKIKRRFVQRMMTYRKPTKTQFIEDAIKAKRPPLEPLTEIDRAVNYERYKFKPACLKKGQTNIKTSSKEKDESKKIKETDIKIEANDGCKSNGCAGITAELVCCCCN